MRNLKKVLALVMAMALTLTMFAGAVDTVDKPTDYDTLSANAQEAVSVLTALKVISGYPDKTFKGDSIVTRAELAKMIYVLKTGDSSAAATFYANADLSKVFKDSVDSWAVPFINYCQLNKIIVGYEYGTRRPRALRAPASTRTPCVSRALRAFSGMSPAIWPRA